MIRAGAQGYVTKTISGNDLISSIKQVHEGYAVFSPKLAGFVLSAFQNGSPTGMGGPASGPIHDDELDRLSNREQEVMRLIARGYTYKEVAAELFISIKTGKRTSAPYYANCSCQTAPNSFIIQKGGMLIFGSAVGLGFACWLSAISPSVELR